MDPDVKTSNSRRVPLPGAPLFHHDVACAGFLSLEDEHYFTAGANEAGCIVRFGAKLGEECLIVVLN